MGRTEAAHKVGPGGSEPFVFLHGRDVERLSETALRRYKQRAFRYWRRRGFPFPKLTHSELRSEYLRYAESTRSVFGPDRCIRWSPLGLSVANYFQRHIWSTHCEGFHTPVEVFESDRMLRACIDRSVSMCHDRRPLTPSNLRSMLSTHSNARRVSNFRPTAARGLYERYSQAGDTILDPSAGYGGRLLGALPLDRRYIGIDPSRRTMTALRRMTRTLEGLVPTYAHVSLIEERAEAVLPSWRPRSVHMAIFSPPYFGRERYDCSRSQSYRRYEDYDSWKIGFLDPVLRSLRRALKPGGVLCLNVANTDRFDVGDDARRIAAKYFRHHYTYKLLIGCVPYHRNGRRGGHRYEPLVVYRR